MTGKAIPRCRELPILGSLSAFQNARLELLTRVWRECGDVGSFHVGPARAVLVSAPALIQEVLVERTDDFRNTGRVQQAFLPIVGPQSLMMLEGPAHRRQRKMNAPSFQHRRLAGFAEPMVHYAGELARSLSSGQEVDLHDLMTATTLRIVGKTLLGVELQGQTDALSVAFNDINHYIVHLASRMVPLPLGWPTPRNVRTRRAIRTVRDTLRRIVDERRREGTQGSDFLSLLLQVRDEDGTPLTDEQVMDHTVTAFGAGHTTVASAISWLFYLLALHPEVQARVLQEVDTVLEGRPPTVEDLPRLAYGLQVVKETLRAYPPTYVIARTAHRDTQLGGWAVRKGDLMVVSPYVLHYHPELFPQPERFEPERFRPEQEKKLPRHAFLPFGAGPHVCIGNAFAMMEAHLLLTVLSQQLTLDLVPGPQVRCVPVASLEPQGLRMRVKRRAGASPQAPSASGPGGS
jgi:cytochrome P450